MDEPAHGGVLIDLLEDHLPALAPARYGRDEPYDAPFERASLAEIWTSPFGWRGRRGSEGLVLQRGKHHYHTTIALTAEPSDIDPDAASRFLRETALRFEADFACAQLLTEPEVRVGRPRRSRTRT